MRDKSDTPKELSADRLAEYAHYARLRDAPAPQDAEAIRALLGHIDAIAAENVALKVERHESACAWQANWNDIKNELLAAEAKLAEAVAALEGARAKAFEDAAKIALKSLSQPNDCESLGLMDMETGVSECALELKGYGCLCSERFEEAERIATAILALAAITKGEKS